MLFFLCTHCIIDILSLSRHILNMRGLMYVYTKFMTSPYIVLHSCSIFTKLSAWHADQTGLFIMGILNFDCMLGIGTQHSVARFYHMCLIKPYNLKLYPVWRICLHGMRVRCVACFFFVQKGYLHTNYMYEKNMKNNGFYKLTTLTLLSEFIAFSFSTLTDILNLQHTIYLMVAWHFLSSWWSSRPLSVV